MWGIATQPWQLMIDDFQKTYPNLKVKWTKYSTDEMKQAVRVASAAGKMSDTWFNWGGSLAAPYEDGGHALEFTPQLMAQYGVDENIVPAALDLARHNGKLYGVPIWVRPMTIFYKKSLFDKYGLTAPKTFEELEKVCETLKSKGIIPVRMRGKVQLDDDANHRLLRLNTSQGRPCTTSFFPLRRRTIRLRSLKHLPS